MGLPDHPRSRGVYRLEVSQGFCAAGSSPLARGLPGRCGFCGLRIGIIPARAGFTGKVWVLRLTYRDHPRSRGVYPFRPAAVQFKVGSSPLARGLHVASVRLSLDLRIIPARAGFTRTRTGITRGRRDHPRSRGVYCEGRPGLGHVSGSSPLARGLLRTDGPLLGADGIIPARAGFTMMRAITSSSWRDHPRSRGVYDQVDLPEKGHPGSSPLARGLRGLNDRSPRVPRIIPARAGFTNTKVSLP